MKSCECQGVFKYSVTVDQIGFVVSFPIILVELVYFIVLRDNLQVGLILLKLLVPVTLSLLNLRVLWNLLVLVH